MVNFMTKEKNNSITINIITFVIKNIYNIFDI